jgi:hypothetical protein
VTLRNKGRNNKLYLTLAFMESRLLSLGAHEVTMHEVVMTLDIMHEITIDRAIEAFLFVPHKLTVDDIFSIATHGY